MRKKKENSSFPGKRDSGKVSSSAMAEGSSSHPPLLPPDPPDPTISSYLSSFPPLSPSHSPAPSLSSPQTTRPSSSVTSSPTSLVAPLSAPLISPSSPLNFGFSSDCTVAIPNSPIVTVNSTAPIISNPIIPTPPLSHSHCSTTQNFPLNTNYSSLIPHVYSTVTTTKPTSPQFGPVHPPTKSWAERLKKVADKSLSQVSPVTPSGSPAQMMIIPDSVFQTGIELHKNFIVGKFLGRPPAFSHVQNVLSSMWNKGLKLEIHLNPLTRSMLIRIPNGFIRSKVLEKKVWHVSESMFYVYPWSPGHSSNLNLEAIPLWAHLNGVPLALMHRTGWSYLASQIGEPKEVDDFTLNLQSVDIAHVKVEANLTKPLPPFVEYAREDGSVHKVPVSYPWLPPTCSHCHELGHVQRFCPSLPPSQPPQKTKPPPKPSPPISSPLTSPSSPAASSFVSSTLAPVSSSPTSTTIITASTKITPASPLPPLSSILASLPANSAIPISNLPFFPSSSIPFFPSSSTPPDLIASCNPTPSISPDLSLVPPSPQPPDLPSDLSLKPSPSLSHPTQDVIPH